jgi:predicted lipid-binding transport protein (Tim44 family)
MHVCAAEVVRHASFYITTTAITSASSLTTTREDAEPTGETQAPPNTAPPSSTSRGGSGLGGGEIAGIVVGVVALIVTVIGVWLNWRTLMVHMHMQSRQQTTMTTPQTK